MTIVIGLVGDDRSKAVVGLGAQLARVTSQRIVVAVIVPRPWWTPGPGRADGEYIEAVNQTAEAALDEARAQLGDTEAEYVVHEAKSTATGLLEVVEEHGGVMLVLGSSREGRFGHVAVGSVTGRLLHSSPVPVALAPRGHRARDARPARLTCAFSGGEGSDEVVRSCSALAAHLGASLRIASFGVRGKTMYPTGVGLRAEDDVISGWREQTESAQSAALESLADQGIDTAGVETVIAQGPDWEDAIDAAGWKEGDLLAVGSSPSHSLKTVFLGSQATRIVRHSSVPVVVLPRD